MALETIDRKGGNVFDFQVFIGFGRQTKYDVGNFWEFSLRRFFMRFVLLGMISIKYLFVSD